MQRTRARFGLLLGALTLVGASAGLATSAASASGEQVEIDWWHIQNADPGMTNWQTMADAYMAEHPNVTINITVMKNEAFKPAIQTNIQAGDVPDLFQSWGGGVLLDQVERRRRAGHHRGVRRVRRRPRPGAASAVQHRRRAVRAAVQPEPGRHLVQRRPLRAGRHRRRRRRRGPSCSRSSRRSRTPASRRSPSAPATSGRRTSGTRT